MAPAKKKEESALEFCIHFPPFLAHVAFVLVVGWMSSLLEFNLPFVFTLGLAYLYFVEQRINAKTRSRIRSEERGANDRKRLLSDAETARWLNSTVEAIWPIFMENFASQKFLMALAPWFFEKYKPWTAKKVVLQQICLGRSPPVFTMLRCGNNPTDGDHLVLEMDMKFVAARDMSAVIAVQVRKRVGFGLWTSLNISNVQIEGKLRVGVRFTRGWPVLERLRVCFAEAPILRMTARPIINYGLDVTDLPGLAGWIDKMIVDALEQSLVEPNFLQVNVEKLVGSMMSVSAQLQTPPSTKSGSWFSVKTFKVPLVSILKVEILEGKKLKPSDPNGKADPYVKVRFGSQKHCTAIKHKTLQPTWHETFQFPVESWDLPNKLELRVRDKDRFGTDDYLGYKEIECKAFNDGQRHDMWVSLDEVKTGQLRIAITVEDVPVTEIITEEKKDSGTPESERSKSQVSPSSTENVPQSSPDLHDYGNYQDSDSEYEERVSGEYQTVDVGYGQFGAVSIVTPGKEQVKEATNVEKLRHRRKHGTWKLHGDGKAALDGKEPSIVGRERRRSKLKKMLIGKKSPSSSSDSSGELCVTGEGEKGTKLHLALETDIPASDLLPSSGELQLGSEVSQDPEECTEEKQKLKKMRSLLQRLGRKAHTVSTVMSRIAPSRKHTHSGKSIGEHSLTGDEEEIFVPETPVGECTGDKVPKAADAAGTGEQLIATDDVGTHRKRLDSEAETDNRLDVSDGLLCARVHKVEVCAVQKVGRVEGVSDSGTSKSPTTAQKLSPNSNAGLASIKESAHDVFHKLKVDCRAAVSTAESLIPRKTRRSPGRFNRSPNIRSPNRSPNSEAAVTTPPSSTGPSVIELSPGASTSSSVTELSPGASNSLEEKDIRTVLPDDAPTGQESRSAEGGPPEGQEMGSTSEPVRGEETESTSKPALVLGGDQSLESRPSFPLPPRASGQVMRWRPLIKIVTDDSESARGSPVNTPVTSPTGRKESPKTPGGIGSASSKFLSRVTAFKDRGLRRSLSCRNPSTAFFASETKDFGEILRGKAEFIRSQRNNMNNSAVVLSPLAEGPSAKAEFGRRQEGRGDAARGESSNISSSLSPGKEAQVNPVYSSSSGGLSASENVTSSASESLAPVTDDILRRNQYTGKTSTTDNSALDSDKDRPAHAEDGNSPLLVSIPGTSSMEAKEMLSTSSDPPTSGAQGITESGSAPEISPDYLPPNMHSPSLAAGEIET